MGKIEKLTAEQEQALVAYHAECMAIGTSTAPADRPRAEAAISKMYQFIGKPQPTFVWCDSPATCILARFVLQEWSKTAKEGNSLETSLRTSLRTSLETSLRTSLRASLGTSLETSLWTSLGTSLETSLRASLGTSLWTSLGTSLRTSLETSLGTSLGTSLETSLRTSLETSLETSLRASLETSLETILWTSLGMSLRTSLETSLRTSLWTSLRTSLWTSLRTSLGTSLRASLETSLGTSLRASLWTSLRTSLETSLGTSLRTSLETSLGTSLRTSLETSLGTSLETSLGTSLGTSLETSLRTSLETSLETSLRASLETSLETILWTSLGMSLRTSLETSLRTSLWTSLRTSLWTSLRTSLGTSLETSLWTSLETSLWTSNWGQQEQYWIGFYRFMELHLKIAYDPQKSGHLGWWNDIAESANWWFPYEGYCFVSERPVRCAIDEERRLHHESLAAMEFKDGWKVYAYHGVTVPAQVIETPETITIEQIKNEENAEVRRCMVERMGWARFYSEAGMKVLHEDTLESNFPSIPISELVSESARLVTSYRPGTETAQLLEAEGIRDYEDRPLRFVRLTDPSTGRQYTLRVLHSHTRCYEAVGWSFGKTEEEYKRGKYVRHGDVGLFPLSGGPTAQTHS